MKNRQCYLQNAQKTRKTFEDISVTSEHTSSRVTLHVMFLNCHLNKINWQAMGENCLARRQILQLFSAKTFKKSLFSKLLRKKRYLSQGGRETNKIFGKTINKPLFCALRGKRGKIHKKLLSDLSSQEINVKIKTIETEGQM